VALPGADAEHDARTADDRVFGVWRAVDEVPQLERPLLASTIKLAVPERIKKSSWSLSQWYIDSG